MIIEQLVLHDFGVFRGRHEIDLAPASPEKPVVLIGALNGRGKTTTLDAINLVLFGQRARLSNRKPNTSWDKYLRESINHRAPGGALVGMRFSIADPFGVRTYDISRSWEVTGKSVKEYFDVSLNGAADRVLAEDWDDHVEGILPLEVASLNFFDGEKIDQLADPAQSRGVIEAAVRGLLGIGVIERLEADLKVYVRRKQSEAIGGAASEELGGIEAEIASLVARREGLVLERGSVLNELERRRAAIADIERRAKSLGSDKWEQRAELESRYRELSSRRATLEAELHSVLEGAAPLRLASALLRRTAQQLARDEEVHLARTVLAELEQRDKSVLAAIDAPIRAQIGAVLDRDREQRAAIAAGGTVHDESVRLRPMVAAALMEIDGESPASLLVVDIDGVASRINDVERQLLAVPSEDQLAPVLEELGRARADEEALAAQHAAMSEEIDHITAVVQRHESNLGRLMEAEADKQKVLLEDRRSREYAARALETAASLIRATVARNLGRVETAILGRFNQLIGKSDLVTGVRIDPETLELGIRSGDDQPIGVERLSAGERQLLATAILWGLSSVAGRPIPLVIDTPLGRLDGDHRANLVDNYFPHAAPQVVILSTDTEFTHDQYARLKPWIGREYTIEFDETEGASRFRTGYLQEAT